MDEHDLIRKSLIGDEKAFDELLNFHEQNVKTFLIQLSNNEFDSNDMLQETFIKAFINLDKYDPAYPFIVWLKAIARNTFLDNVRKKNAKNKVVLLDSDHIVEMQVADNEENEVLTEKNDTLAARIEEMEDIYKEIIELRYYKGLDYKEIAEQLDVPVSTVKTRLFRARQKLK